MTDYVISAYTLQPATAHATHPYSQANKAVSRSKPNAFELMLMFLVSRAVTAWFNFLLPSYKTFQALRKNPHDEREIQKWAGYWVVIGVVVAFEYTAEWLLSWFPFYWEIKTLVLLFLSLPQFEGSTYVYTTYLEPYLIQNESNIDASIAAARDESFQYLQARLTALWDIIYSLLSKTPMKTENGNPAPTTNGPSPLGISQQALYQSVQGLWSTAVGVGVPPFLAASAPGGGEKPTVSRSTSDTFASDKRAPAAASGTTVGYDLGGAN